MMNQKTLLNFRRIGAVLVGLIGLWAAATNASEVFGPEIATPAPEGSRQHHLATTSDGRLLLSWVEGSGAGSRLRFAVRQGERWSEPRTIAVERRSFAAPPVVLELTDGALTAAWMTHIDKTRDPYAAEIHLARSIDGGRSWNELPKSYPQKARVYDAQLSSAALRSGRLALAWTDTRNEKSHNRFQLMATVIDQNGGPGPEMTVDNDVCSCCETGMAAQGDNWLLAYRDHLAGEVRDIALAQWQGGKLMTHAVRDDHWVIQGCPSNGPAVDWKGPRVLVAWFTAADGAGRVKVAFSADNGSRFENPIEIDADAYGYVGALLLEDGSALLAWRGRAGPVEELRTARIRPDGRVSDRATLYRGDFPRWPSRHIRLAQTGNEVYVAWIDPAGPRVRLAKVTLAAASIK
ncbi:MAG: sialidase family protein [Gammaproteobacteria bacterium]